MGKKAMGPMDEARKAAASAQGAARELTNGAIRCSIEGCGGIVRADFVVTTVNGKALSAPIGLCPQREIHQALAQQDPNVQKDVRLLLQWTRMARLTQG